MLTIVMSYKQYLYFAVINPQVSHVLGGGSLCSMVGQGPALRCGLICFCRLPQYDALLHAGRLLVVS